MRLILIRHARAEERDERAWPDDRLRPLIARGRKEHRSVACALAKMDLGISTILTSPWLRARETAEITAQALSLDPGHILECDELGDRCSTAALLKRLSRLPAGEAIAAVGHEPYLSEIAADLLDPSGRIAIEFKKSGVLGLDFEGSPSPGCGTLRFFLVPKILLPLVE